MLMDLDEVSVALRGAAMNNLALVHVRAGESVEARSTYREALALSRRAGDAQSEAQALGNLGTAERVLGDLDAARQAFEAALELYDAMGDPDAGANVAGNLGLLLQIRDEEDLAMAYFERCLAGHRARADVQGEGVVLGYIGWTHECAGQMDEALAHYAAARVASERAGDALRVAVYTVTPGRLALADERFEEARPILAEGVAALEQLWPDEAARYRMYLAGAMAGLGEAEAAAVGDQAIAGVRSLRDPGRLLVALCERVELAQMMNDPAAARRALAEAEGLELDPSCGSWRVPDGAGRPALRAVEWQGFVAVGGPVRIGADAR
jgi:tetratricopeptide (TPR) repeat protein